MVRTTALLLAGLLVLAGCSGGAAPAAPEVLGEWELVSGSAAGGPLPRPAGMPATLSFEGAQLGGVSFCNHYSGGYRLDGDALTVEPLGGTEMGCDPEVMAAEAAFLGALAAADHAAVEGVELVLTGADVALRFQRPAPVVDRELAGTRWVLDTLVEGETAASVLAEPTLQLAPDGTAAGSTGCRPFRGTWHVSGDVLALPDLTRDDIGCPADLGRQDEHVLAVLDAGPRFAIAGDRLTLSAADGRGLSYRAG